ncbi:unnamed protein product, partial [Phaeothamnion confervicola]
EQAAAHHRGQLVLRRRGERNGSARQTGGRRDRRPDQRRRPPLCKEGQGGGGWAGGIFRCEPRMELGGVQLSFARFKMAVPDARRQKALRAKHQERGAFPSLLAVEGCNWNTIIRHRHGAKRV